MIAPPAAIRSHIRTLSDRETQKLWRDCRPETDPANEVNFKLRENSLPPPRAGDTIKRRLRRSQQLPRQSRDKCAAGNAALYA